MDSLALVDVSITGGGQNVGALAAYNHYGSINVCSVSGEISNNLTGGSWYTGGLAGTNYYGTISNCFWNTETSGQATSIGGLGKTTEEMKQQTAFTGWDFTDIWLINEGVSYPYLKDNFPPVIPTAIPEPIGGEAIRIYPNPIVYELRIDNLQSNSLQFTIFDLTGKYILSGNLSNGKSINISHLLKGMYIMEMNGAKAKFVKK